MTGKADFTPEEWDTVLEGPPSAGMIVVTAQRGGTFRETFAIGKAYSEARAQHGASELLDEIVAAKPEVDHTRYHSYDELKQHGLQHLRDAVEVLDRKATPEEVEDYRNFVADARREGGQCPSRGRNRGQPARAGGDRRDLGRPRQGRRITRESQRRRQHVRKATASSAPSASAVSGGSLPHDVTQAAIGEGRLSVSARCWCDGQYPLCGSGIRAHGVPRRVVARHCNGFPLASRPFCGRRSRYSSRSDT